MSHLLHALSPVCLYQYTVYHWHRTDFKKGLIELDSVALDSEISVPVDIMSSYIILLYNIRWNHPCNNNNIQMQCLFSQ